MIEIVTTLFDAPLSDIDAPQFTISKKAAGELFSFFRDHPLFNWKNAHNGCEGKADAVCVLLDEWNIPNYKAWVFGGAYLKKNHVGELIKNWKYHVAPVLPILEDGRCRYYVLDPATGGNLQPVEEWAAGITQVPHSYYCIRQSKWYIFPPQRISIRPWHPRDRQNRKWMIQCLAGINGLSAAGKAKLRFRKGILKAVAVIFEKLKKDNPVAANQIVRT